MDKRIKVDFDANLLSMHHYMSEVPVEGITTGMYFKILRYNEHYVIQIIRTGNCITLLSTVIPITVDNFLNINYLEDITRFVFWTFNKSFVLKLTEKLESLKPSVVVLTSLRRSDLYHVLLWLAIISLFLPSS